MHEKPFAAITVQSVLDRAHVGRATFYAHFRDKDDLFLSDIEEFFSAMATALSARGDRSPRVVPVREFFAHVGESKELYAAFLASGRIRDVLQIGEECFARGIERRLAERPGGSAMPPRRRSALSHACAGALMSLLSWWIDRGMPVPASEMDDLYHQMIGFGVAPPAATVPIDGRQECR
jgi:AcrR family transcriptional regulator